MGKGKEVNKRCAVKVFLRILELSLKGSSGIHWITCLPATPGERQPDWVKPTSGPVNSGQCVQLALIQGKKSREVQRGRLSQKADFREQVCVCVCSGVAGGKRGQQRNMG